eukprot:9928331-Alexandrium_andersonii.AAC.2
MESFTQGVISTHAVKLLMRRLKNASIEAVHVQTHSGCAAPPLPAADEGDVQAVVLGDPASTDQTIESGGADFWLHPCDCLPRGWGNKPPVDPEVFKSIPPESDSLGYNEFAPGPTLISEGALACSSIGLIDPASHASAF